MFAAIVLSLSLQFVEAENAIAAHLNCMRAVEVALGFASIKCVAPCLVSILFHILISVYCYYLPSFTHSVYYYIVFFYLCFLRIFVFILYGAWLLFVVCLKSFLHTLRK